MITLTLLPFGAVAAPQAAPSAVVVKRFSENPVEMATGDFVQREPADLQIKSRGLMLGVSRNYRSRREASGVFGYGWSWNHGERLEFPGDFVIHYVTPDAVIAIIPDVAYTGAYAKVCLAAPGWSQGSKATGLPDATGGYGNVAHYYGPIAGLQPLVVGGWGLTPPVGPSTILQVDLTSIGATSYDADHPLYGLSLTLSAGGTHSVRWGHRAYDFDYVDITGDRASWTWDDVNAVEARLELGSYIINQPMDIIADTFHLGVTYTRNGSGEFKYLPGTTFELVKTNNEYWITNKNRTRLAFGLDGRLLRKIDADGNVLTYRYDEAGRLQGITDALQQSIAFTYETGVPEARIVRLDDHLGRSVGFTYQGDNLVMVTNVLGHVTHYSYADTETVDELRHNLIRRTDPEGHAVGISYHTTNSMTDRVNCYQDGELAEGRTNEVRYLYLKGTTYSWRPGSKSVQGVVYNSSNDISQIFIREGDLVYQESDGINLWASHGAGQVHCADTSAWVDIQAALGVTNGLMAFNPSLGTNSALSAAGWGFAVPGLSNDIVQVVLSVRAMATNPVCLSVPGMALTNWSSSNVTSIVFDLSKEKGRWTWLDVSNLTVQIAVPPGFTNTGPVWVDGFSLKVAYRHFDPGRDPQDLFYYHDLSHNLVSSDRGGSIHQFAYDERGNLVAWTDAENHTRRYEYDPVFNKPTRTWDALGQATCMEYDRNGRLVRTTDAGGNTTTQEYDGYGNLVRSTDASGAVEEMTYDARGLNVVRSRNGRGYETVYETDAYGNCTRVTAPDGGRRHASYNAAGWKTSERDEAGVETRYEYDRNGHLTNVVTASGTSDETAVGRSVDGRGLEIETRDAYGRAEWTEHDADGRPVCRIDRNGAQTFTEYDENGNPWRITDALGQTSERFHDVRGNILVGFDRRGVVSSNAYDGNNNPVLIIDKSGNQIVASYDPGGNKTSETWYWAGYPGCPESDLPGPLHITYAYDALNRVTNKTEGAGRPDARSTGMAYNPAGRVIRETDAAGNVRCTDYDATGNITNSCLVDAAGHMVEWTASAYDGMDRLVLEIKSGLATNHYKYDQRGLKIAAIDPNGRQTSFAYDRHRRLVETAYPDGTTQRVAYDRVGNKVREVGVSGLVTGYEWDPAGRMVRKIIGVGLPDARIYRYQYDHLGRMTSAESPLGDRTYTVYDAENNVISETNGLGYVRAFDYDAAGRVTNAVDEMGHRVAQWLDGRGHPCRIVDKRGGLTSLRYDGYGRLGSQIDPLGYSVSYDYDRRDNKIREMDARGMITRYDYDSAGRMTNRVTGVGAAGAVVKSTIYDFLGRVTAERVGGLSNTVTSSTGYAYDPAGNLVSSTDARGNATCYAYDVMGRQREVRDACGGVTQTRIDQQGHVVARVDALGGTTRFTYDAYGLQKTRTEACGGVVRYEYDRLGRLTNTVDELGGTEARRYDAADNLVSLKWKNGGITVMQYDPMGRVTNTLDACGHQTRRTYDAAGNIITETDGRGNTTRYGVDALNRIISIRDAASNTVYIAFDGKGNKVREVLPSGLVTTYGYDGLGRLVLKTTGAGRGDARRTRYEHDHAGRVVAEWNPYGQVVRTGYDASGNRTHAVDARGYQTRFYYDSLNRLTRTVDALGHSAEVEYDAMGRIVRAINRRGGITRHQYDAEGHLVLLEDPEGNTKRNRYDLLGRLVEETDPNGLRTVMSYDLAGQVTNRTRWAANGESRSELSGYDCLGRVIRATDPLGVVSEFVRDAAGNVATESVYSAQGILLRTKSAQYDSRNQPVLEVDWMGAIWRTEYDAMGRKAAFIDPSGNRTAYDWNIYNEPAGTTDPAGYRSQVLYDLCGREVERINALGQRVGYRFDANGNRTAVINDNGTAVLTHHDPLNRAIKVNRSMPDVHLDELDRADINGDGQVDAADVTSLEERLQ